jgi:hypothetical protein
LQNDWHDRLVVFLTYLSTHQGFINFFKGNRFCEFTGNFENDVQAKATVIGCMKEDETIVNIEMPNEPMKKLLLRNGVTFNEEV